MFLLSRLTLLGGTRHLVTRGRKMLVASAAAPTFCHNNLVFRSHQISDNHTRISIFHNSSGWHLDNNCCTRRAGHIFASSFFARFRLKMDLPLKR